MKVKPMGMLLMMLARWINRHQQDVILKARLSSVQDSLLQEMCRWVFNQGAVL